MKLQRFVQSSDAGYNKGRDESEYENQQRIGVFPILMAMEEEPTKNKLNRRATKKERRKYRISGKGLAQWYQNVVIKALKKRKGK
ncbi:MAG: hypothetical protein V3T71_02690 [Dehalococcoidia bacterium]|jgi:hypothetical protein